MLSEPAAVVKNYYAHKRLKLFQKGESILSPDETKLPLISYIEKGAVQQFDITDDGEKVVVNIFKEGAFFPASSAVNHTMNTYYFEALSGVSVRQATSEEIDELLRANPAVVFDLLQRLYRGVDGILSKLSSALSQTAGQRLLTELNIHSQRFGVRQMDNSVELAVTAEQIAHQTGLTRETVSRELKKLQKEGRILMKRGMITMLSDDSVASSS